MAHGLIPVNGNISNPVAPTTPKPVAGAADLALLQGLVRAPGRDDRNSTPILSYPLDVGSESQGHYITFYIRVVWPAQLKAFKAAQGRIAATNKRLAAEAGISGLDNIEEMSRIVDSHAVSGYTFSEDQAKVGGDNSGGIKSNSIQLKRGTTVRLDSAISLYMPPNVQVSYESKYADQTIGVLAETGYEVIKSFMRGKGTKEAMTNAVTAAFEGGEEAIRQMTLAAVDLAAPGAKALFAIERGKVITPKMELMFEGIGRRNFSFSFVFIPKSKPEAQAVHNIVSHFKYHMAADFKGGGVNGVREMSFPDLFDIEYMHIGKQNPNLNKIATCALTKMDVEYGGDRYVAYDDGVPQTTKLTLSFTEMEIITKEHIAVGF